MFYDPEKEQLEHISRVDKDFCYKSLQVRPQVDRALSLGL